MVRHYSCGGVRGVFRYSREIPIFGFQLYTRHQESWSQEEEELYNSPEWL